MQVWVQAWEWEAAGALLGLPAYSQPGGINKVSFRFLHTMYVWQICFLKTHLPHTYCVQLEKQLDLCIYVWLTNSMSRIWKNIKYSSFEWLNCLAGQSTVRFTPVSECTHQGMHHPKSEENQSMNPWYLAKRPYNFKSHERHWRLDSEYHFGLCLVSVKFGPSKAPDPNIFYKSTELSQSVTRSIEWGPA